LMSGIGGPRKVEVKTIGYVDNIGTFNNEASPSPGHTKFVRFGTAKEATQALVKKEVAEYVVIPADYMSTGTVRLYSLRKETEYPFLTNAAVKSFLTANLLDGKLPPDIVNRVKAPLRLDIIRLTKTGEPASGNSGVGTILLSTVFALLLGLSLMLSSNYLLQGLGEEKESRLIEVLLCSSSVRELLTGKVLGLGAAGLAQIMVWLLSAPLLPQLAPSSIAAFIGNIQISPIFYVLAAVYFILGYLLFAVLSIGVGAICPNAREGQLLAMIYTLCSFVPLWLLSLLLIFPDSPIWVVLTIFPITAPVQTMLRLGVAEVPVWQILAGIIALGGSIILGLVTAIKIFRVHLLMHGKRPGIAEIIRNLKNT
ncbi:MAG: ABC transporter permease, partial [bacterium]|nr:ABC transporter permease [bacterium]